MREPNYLDIANSSMVKLNITGKESSGNYCCIADNTYANDTKCATVRVTGIVVYIYHRKFRASENVKDERAPWVSANKGFFNV